MVVHQSDQVMHCWVQIIANNKWVYCSFVYVGNKYTQRRELWKELSMHKRVVDSKPWMVLGDFNVGLNFEDSRHDTSSLSIGMSEFHECVEHIGVEDINQSGMHSTWNQRPNATSGILKKLDLVIGNGEFISSFVNAYAVF